MAGAKKSAKKTASEKPAPKTICEEAAAKEAKKDKTKPANQCTQTRG